MALQQQFDQSQWWSPAELALQQCQQLREITRHAFRTAPFWRDHLAGAGYREDMEPTAQWLAGVPIATRPQVQAAGDRAFSQAVPPEHGTVQQQPTSGSTGTPMLCASTGLSQLLWSAITLREMLWHGRDLSGKLAAIRVGAPRAIYPSWHAQACRAYATGPSVTLDARTGVDAQIDWLREQRPDYLLSHATNLHALARRCAERGERLDGLREALSFSEMLPADLRPDVQAAWGVPLVDLYSANEAGYLALQCPQSERYHVQAETVLLEVVDDEGRRCGPGDIGRVLVTSLHNFAMPLLRYEIGDYAEAGSPCACGRGLPVLTRVMGRRRNMLRLPRGGSCWPGVPLHALTTIAPIRQFQIVQDRIDGIELRVVSDRPLAAGEEQALRAALHQRLQHPFDVRFTRVERFERGAGNKFEDVVCLLS